MLRYSYGQNCGHDVRTAQVHTGAVVNGRHGDITTSPKTHKYNHSHTQIQDDELQVVCGLSQVVIYMNYYSLIMCDELCSEHYFLS